MSIATWGRAGLVAVVLGLLVPTTLPASAEPAEPAAGVVGPLPGTVPGDRLAERIEDTYPFFSTPVDLAARGYVEEEFHLSGRADGWATDGTPVATDVAYTTRVVVRRPVRAGDFSGTALVEWQNVTAGYDLDALWNAEATIRAGHAWVGVSAQRVGVDQLRAWSPARYGGLDVTGGGRYVTDELSYDIFTQAGRAVENGAVMGRLRPRTVLAIGASQSAGRMTVLYDRVLPQMRPVFDGYAFVVGTAPTRVGKEPVFQLLSETDVRSAQRPADTDRFRRWEVAGTAHSGHEGQVYRAPISERDLGGAPQYTCDRPPFSRVPMHHVTAAAYEHLRTWVERGTPPPTAPPLAFEADGVTKTRDDLGLAVGGIRLSQVVAPTALNTGDNSGESFCRLFGTHVPFDGPTLARLYPNHGAYVSRVIAADAKAVRAGYLLPADAKRNHDEPPPVIFVHGQQGSAHQWQSNAKRFSANGYADGLLYAYEYDTSVATNDQAVAGLDAFIADVRTRTGASTVDIVAHSRGTTVMHAYLATPARAALVRRYVNVDGRSSATLPGGVPTLALWGSLQPGGSIGGATNVRLPHLGHTETATSAESFTHVHQFLRDRPPITTEVTPQPPGHVAIAGRAVLFPQNSGVAGRLQVWEVDDRTGARRDRAHDVNTRADGSFGPLKVNGRKHYEIVLLREGQQTYHFYFEPFERSDHFLRLQVSGPGGIADYVDKCPTHTALTVLRGREWWSDQPDNDRLELDGVNVLDPAVAPRARQVLATFAFDDGCDRTSTLGSALPPFNALPFLTAVDSYLPTQPPTSIRVTEVARGSGGTTRTVAVPNWPSDEHSVTVQFKDYLDRKFGDGH
ncbi:alpha/beta hydrolase domain-containing protein [Actinophytocola algeriensis]|uniref:Pimeloyl-ACP methyl ester carboxylesterase n=1 Tax=Actinophytocola algeriensis TaxID=1768010 RepID=A0A7W7Q156_9PSEU|nr:alpha/beta hydrolase domain-containing protein [Actinophytocola algeriensis]MBB4905090.1 pimeloyl-ACP methyl ester carboxylesterase [Actinophytocola algeriensis]MBE1473225.1 pimeloyl-ACP methyl ester carboxylesterase [Actinophytocola algeriensis]